MMVAVALFATVMVVSMGALMSLIDANRKAQSLQSVMGNLNTALDSMVRSLRQGQNFHCNKDSGPSLTEPNDCPSGDDSIAFQPFEAFGSPLTRDTMWVYWLSNGRIYKSEQGGDNGVPVTAPEVQIDYFRVYVVGTEPGDSVQPKVVIVVRGTAGGEKIKTQTTFNIQATATQRVLDI